MKAGKFILRSGAGLTLAAAVSIVGLSSGVSGASGVVPSAMSFPTDGVATNGLGGYVVQMTAEVGVLTDIVGTIDLAVEPTGTVTFSDSNHLFHITRTLPTDCLAIPVVYEHNCSDASIDVSIPAVAQTDEITVSYSGDSVLASSSDTFAVTD